MSETLVLVLSLSPPKQHQWILLMQHQSCHPHPRWSGPSLASFHEPRPSAAGPADSLAEKAQAARRAGPPGGTPGLWGLRQALNLRAVRTAPTRVVV